MSKPDVSTEVGMRGLEYFRANATVNTHGVATLTQKHFFDFHKAEGIDKDTIERFNASENELLNGAYLYGNELMRKAAEAASNEEEAAKASAKVRITKPNETINLTAVSRVTCRIPRKPEDIAAGKPTTTTKYGVTSVKIDRHRAIGVGVVERCETAAKALFK